MNEETFNVDTLVQRPDRSEAARNQPDEPRQSLRPAPPNKTPEEFYAEITQRADVREILEELATSSGS